MLKTVVSALLFVLLIGVDVKAQMATDQGLEIKGLLLDETKTKAGRDFFEFFTVNWPEFEGINYTIKVEEQPGLGRGSFIEVALDNNQVFFNQLQTRTDDIEELAKNAVDVTRAMLIQKLTTKQELEGAP